MYRHVRKLRKTTINFVMKCREVFIYQIAFLRRQSECCADIYVIQEKKTEIDTEAFYLEIIPENGAHY